MTPFRAVVSFDVSKVPADTLVLVPGQNLRTGLEDFKAIYPDFTTLEADVLTVSSAIFACDLAFKRGEREEVTRSIELTVPVVNYQAFQSHKDALEVLLFVLSHDNWTLTFKWAAGEPEPSKAWTTGKGSTILFSGGVDSFVGAVDLLSASPPDRTQLASHITGNPVVRNSQDDLLAHLIKRFGSVSKITIRTGGRKKGDLEFPSDADREETQRTRSFMFVAIAALAARRSGHNELVVIAENGQMAIHLPLSAARIGAFSTHTAHPEFVTEAANFFGNVFNFPFKITNPYLYMTKAELVARIDASDRTVLNKSVSCWRGSRVSSFNHCGECVPCLVRRIAFEYNDIQIPEYKRDLFSEDVRSLPEDDEGKRNLVELAEFAYAFATQSDSVLEFTFPDLISPEFDKAQVISMYRRFAAEADLVLREYAGPASLLAPKPAAPAAAKANKETKS